MEAAACVAVPLRSAALGAGPCGALGQEGPARSKGGGAAVQVIPGEVEVLVKEVRDARVVGPRGFLLRGVAAKRFQFAVDLCPCFPFLPTLVPTHALELARFFHSACQNIGTRDNGLEKGGMREGNGNNDGKRIELIPTPSQTPKKRTSPILDLLGGWKVEGLDIN